MKIDRIRRRKKLAEIIEDLRERFAVRWARGVDRDQTAEDFAEAILNAMEDRRVW